MPPKALEQIRRLFPEDEELEIARGENHLGFRSPFTAVFTRLIEGPYPNYDQVIPQRQQSRRDRRSHGADQRAAPHVGHRVGPDAPHPAVVQRRHAHVQRADARPRRSERRAGGALQRRSARHRLQREYLLEILRYIPTDEVRLTFKAPERAATLEPEGWTDPATYLCLVMPLRLLD